METMIGFVILLLLGYLASYQFQTFFRRWKGLDQFLTSGFFFVFIGVLFGPNFWNIISPEVLRQLDPFIYLGLGWIGFIIGLQFEGRLLRHVPRGFFLLAQLESLVSGLCLLAGLLCLLSAWAAVMKISDFDVWTSALILTAGGMVSSSLAIHYYARMLPDAAKALRPLEFLVSLHVFVPLLVLLFLYSFFHVDQAGHARFPGWVWLIIHGVTGLMLGIMLFCLLNVRLSENERLSLILGGITFSAGVAGYLHISPVVVCFIAGIVFANMPGFNHLLMDVVVRRAERPVYFILLILAGSLWDFHSLPVWGFLAAYVLIRILAKGFAFRMVSRREPSLGLRPPLLGGVLAQGPLAIAVVVGYEQLYANELLPHVVTAILGGSIINEFLAGKLLIRAFPVPESQKVKNEKD